MARRQAIPTPSAGSGGWRAKGEAKRPCGAAWVSTARATRPNGAPYPPVGSALGRCVLLREGIPASSSKDNVLCDRTGSPLDVKCFKPCAIRLLVLASLTAVMTSGSVSAFCARRHHARLLRARPSPRRAAEAERQPDPRSSTVMRPAVEKTRSRSRHLVGTRRLKCIGRKATTAASTSSDTIVFCGSRLRSARLGSVFSSLRDARQRGHSGLRRKQVSRHRRQKLFWQQAVMRGSSIIPRQMGQESTLFRRAAC